MRTSDQCRPQGYAKGTNMHGLLGRSFTLVSNNKGDASESTIMQFGTSIAPQIATYSGPNIVYGHAIVAGDEMLYHALGVDGNVKAGRAKVNLDGSDDQPLTMTLRWSWFTGDKTSGTSVWHETRA